MMFASMHRRSLQLYQGIVLFCVISLSVSLLYFWKNGYLDGTKNRKLNDVSYKLKSLEKRSELKSVKKFIFKNELKRSLTTLNAFKNQVAEIDRIVKVDDAENVYKAIGKLNNSIKDIAQYPKVKEILKIYNEKMGNFENFVYFNNWKTLSRLSKRINARMNALHFSDATFYSAITENEKDIKKMKLVTKRSVLVKSLKSKIQKRLDSLLVELSMLKEYLKLRKKSSGFHNKLNSKFNKWLDIVVPEVAVQKLKTEQVGRLYFTTFSVITAVFFGVFLLAFPLSNRLIGRGRDEQELEVLELIEKSLIEENEKALKGTSSHFKRKIEQFSKHLKKRMNFGSIFQESLPFDSVLIDENFKVVWGNEQFFEKWGIAKENMIKETISWDYLAKLIEFGESDPVIDALKNNFGGIFEVKVKLPNRDEKISYEVYVSPVENNGKKHAMIFFYCLESLQTAISEYQETAITPLEKMMNIFSLQMSKNDLTELKVLFDDKELTHLYKKFETLYDSIKISTDSFMKQVDELETENSKLTEQLNSETSTLKKQLDDETTMLSSRLENETAILSTKIEDQVEEYEGKLEEQRVSSEEKYNTMKEEYESLLKEKVEMYESELVEKDKMFENIMSERVSKYENQLQSEREKHTEEMDTLTSTFKDKYQQKMQAYNDRIQSDAQMLEDRLQAQLKEYTDSLEHQREFFVNRFQSIAKENGYLVSGNQSLKKELKTIKDNLINISNNNSEILQNSRRAIELFSKSLVNYKDIVAKNEELFGNLREGLSSVPNAEEVKAEFQALRRELQESKHNVFQNFQQLVNFKKYVKDFEGKKKLHEIVTGAKSNIKDLDEKTNLLDKRFQFIEYQISTTTKLLKDNSDQAFEKRLQTDNKIITVMENGKNVLARNFDSLSGVSEGFEDHVISSVKNVYDTYKRSNANSHTISEEIEQAYKFSKTYASDSNSDAIR